MGHGFQVMREVEDKSHSAKASAIRHKADTEFELTWKAQSFLYWILVERRREASSDTQKHIYGMRAALDTIPQPFYALLDCQLV
jgi:hypothetical protein